jgi:peptidoglycan hydrolase-like protein with peptidoglycan-binding domain
MKRLAFLVLFLIGAAFLTTGTGQYETVGAMKDLPKFDRDQSRWGVATPADWKEFDQSGEVKFLQVQTTAPASAAGHGSVLDGSLGERIVEIQAEPNAKGPDVEWILTNKGPSPVWVVAGGLSGAGFNQQIPAGDSRTFTLPMDGSGYTYLVVDNDSGGKTELDLSAKINDIEAKTTRGSSMVIIWF